MMLSKEPSETNKALQGGLPPQLRQALQALQGAMPPLLGQQLICGPGQLQPGMVATHASSV